MTDVEEKVIMTPKSKTATSTTIVIERKAVQAEESKSIHVAGGDHTGIIINKELVHENGSNIVEECHCALTFRVWLTGADGTHTREARSLRFWFAPELPPAERPHHAQLFFRDLVSPTDFPKDYVGFIKKIMKLMQGGHHSLRTLEVTLALEPSTRNSSPPPAVGGDITTFPWEQGGGREVSERRVLELIENAYPSPLTAEDVARVGGGEEGWGAGEVRAALTALSERGLTKQLPTGQFVRQHSVDTQVVRTMPALEDSRQPRVAVVTALYCEKQAVDAVMDVQETYVRYTTLGESTVYTVGSVAGRGVVSTKLPVVGRSREALTAAGNAVTRLLGIFQKVEYVVTVGVGGGVAHYTDAARHVRLGDVVMSTPPLDHPDSFVYAVLTGARRQSGGAGAGGDGWEFDMKPYRPADLTLQHVARQLTQPTTQPDWDMLLEEGMRRVEALGGCEAEAGGEKRSRWAGGADRLCMPLGAGRYIEMQHPALPDQTDGKQRTRVHCAPVIGAAAVRGAREEARAAFAWHARALATDCELDAVLDSVQGNRKDCFINIRGIADYADGSVGTEWQGRAALAAAVVLRALLQRLPPTPLQLATL